MSRPCFLVVDREFPGSISTRKLVLETAKLNVITAYDEEEALELLQRFPLVDGIVLSSTVSENGCRPLVERLRALNPTLPIIATSMNADADCGDVTHHLPSHEPGLLLDVLKRLFPRAVEEILSDELVLERTTRRLNEE